MKDKIGNNRNVYSSLMERFERAIFIMAIMAAFLVAALASCVKNLDDNDKPGVGETGSGDGSALVTLSLSTPRLPDTRAATPGSPAENRVEEVDVLLFKNNKFYYRAIGEIIDDGSPARATQEYRVKLPFGNNYTVVVITNANTEINNVPSAAAMPIATIDASGTKDRAALLDSIEWSVAGKIDKSAGFPMHGSLDNVTISETTTTISTTTNPLLLTRAAARVDVSVLTSDFVLSSVRLYNRSDKGRVAPGATAPNIPAGTTKITTSLLYDASDGLTATGIEESIYVFESPVEPDWKDNTCLVIGGSYYNSSQETFYRVDFIDTNGDHVPLLRNGLYHVAISAASAAGWENLADALSNKPVNLTVDIINTKDLNNITFNNHHFLAVNRDHLEFHAEGNAKTLFVLTDYPGGWKVDISSLPAWLTVTSADNGPREQVCPLTLTATPLSSGALSDHFRVIAGNLEKWITVTQTPEGEFSLEVEPEQLTFYKTATARTITVTPFPAGGSNTLTFSSSPVFGTWDIFPSSMTAVAGPLQLKPADNNAAGAVTRSGTLLVTLSDGSRAITRVVTVRQLARDIFDALLANPYPAAAGTYTFEVISDVPWKLAEAHDELALLGDETTFHPATASHIYSFTLTLSTSYAKRLFTVNVTSTEPLLPSSFVIEQAGWTPTLVILEPEAVDDVHSHDFGEVRTTDNFTARATTAKVKTNAPWKITISGNTDVATPSIGENATQDAGHSPEQADITRSITFTPLANYNYFHNTILSSTVTFSTVTGTANEATRDLILKRTVPTVFTLLGISLASDTGPFVSPAAQTIPASGGTILVNASSNAHWYINHGSSFVNQEVTTY